MENKRADLGRRLECLRKRAEQDKGNLETVLELLRKADERRTAEPQNRLMWHRVLDNLERSLIEARARLQSGLVEKSKLERELDDLIGPQAAPASKEAALDNPSAEFESPLPVELAREILARPVEELAQLTLQDVSALYEKIALENIAAAAPETAPALAALELAVTVKEPASLKPGESAESGEKRRQNVLKGALEKIQTNRIAAMTAEEVQMTFASYDALCKRANRGPKDDRLRRILGAAVQIINRNRVKAWKEQQPS